MKRSGVRLWHRTKPANKTRRTFVHAADRAVLQLLVDGEHVHVAHEREANDGDDLEHLNKQHDIQSKQG